MNRLNILPMEIQNLIYKHLFSDTVLPELIALNRSIAWPDWRELRECQRDNEPNYTWKEAAIFCDNEFPELDTYCGEGWFDTRTGQALTSY